MAVPPRAEKVRINAMTMSVEVELWPPAAQRDY